jgi:hypothetical protein
VYLQFKDIYNDMNTGFSRFAYLYQKHCNLTVVCGIHSIYMYTAHQHARVMLKD